MTIDTAALTVTGAVDFNTSLNVDGTVTSDGLTVAGNVSVDGGTIKLDGNYPTGTGNVALGDTALDSGSLSGGYNTAIGASALSNATSGAINTAIGFQSMFNTTTGVHNSGLGQNSLVSNTTGGYNVAVGSEALQSNATGAGNVAVGYQSGSLVGDEIVATAIVSGVNYTIQTLGTTDFTLIGAASNTVGTSFTATGAGTGTGTASANANYNTFVGYQSGDLIVGGSKNSILGRFDGNQGGLDIRNSDNNIVLSDGDGNPRMRIDSSGNVGIGTTSPSDKLTVDGSIVSQNAAQGAGNLQLQGYGATAFINHSGTGDLIFRLGTSYSERMRITSDGNVGIGIAPNATGGGYKALQLGLMTNWAFPTTGSAYRSHNLYYDGTNRKYVTTGTAHEYEQSSAGHVFSTAASGTAGTNVTLSEAMRIDSSGRVGIGTDSPSSYDFNDPAKLVVANTSGNSTLSIASGSSSIGYLAFADGTSGTSRYAGSILYNHSTNYMSMQTTDGTERMRIDSSGSLTLDPNANGAHYLVLNTSTSGDGHIILQRNTSNKYQIAAGTSNELQFYNYTAGSESMRIDSSGRVGIGTTSPQGKFNVSDSGGYGFEFFPNDASLNHLLSYDRTASVYRDFKLSGSQIIFGYGQSGSNEAMRINSSGNVGIGIDSPSSRLDIRNTGGTYDKGISIQTNSGGNIGTIWTTNTDLNLGIAGAHIFTNYDGSSERMRIDSSGNVRIAQTSADWGSLSVEQDFDAKSDISVTAGNYAYIDLPAYQHAGLIIVKVLNDGNSNANLSKLYLYNSRATAFGGGNSVTEVAGTQGSTGTSAEPVISAVAITNTVSGDNPRLRLSVTTVGGTGTLSVYARCINV